MKKIQIIIPCFNEEDNIGPITREIEKIFSIIKYNYEIIFVDDGSTDNTFNIMLEARITKKNISIIKFSKNFGKEAAIEAGLKNANADAIIIMDSDLQHPPNLIPSIISNWENGSIIVDAVKKETVKEGLLNRISRKVFNRFFSSLIDMDFYGASDYKLLDKQAVDIINSIEEKNRFFRGLICWIGFKHSKVDFKVGTRKYGKTKWNWIKLILLSINSITSFSYKPLQIVTILGIFTILLSMILGIQTLYMKFYGEAVSGFTTVILVILILCSIIMISNGIIGMYIAKIYLEIKKRPNYIIEKYERKDEKNDLQFYMEEKNGNNTD